MNEVAHSHSLRLEMVPRLRYIDGFPTLHLHRPHVPGGRDGMQDSFSSERTWALDSDDMMHIAAGYAMVMMIVMGMAYNICFASTDPAEKPCCIFPHTQ